MPERRLLLVGTPSAAKDRVYEALRPCDAPWQLHLVASTEEAMASLAQAEVDGVITAPSLRQPDSAAFLDAVRERHPTTARMVWTDGTPADVNAGSMRSAQALMTSSSTAEVLRDVIVRTVQLQQVIGKPAIQRLVAGVEKLPSAPRMYWSLVRALDRSDTSARDLAEIVECDPAMVVKVLQIANSASFSRSQRLTSIAQAIPMIGVDMLKGLVLGAHVFSTFATERLAGFSVEMFQRYSVRVGRLVRRMVPGPQAEHAFTAALLHDLGKMIVAVRLPQQLAEVSARVAKTGEPVYRVERDIIGAGHAEIGACLLGMWGLPTAVVEAVAYHHLPSEAGGRGGDFRIVGAVHSADALLEAISSGDDEDGLDLAFLERAGLLREVAGWRKLAEQEAAND